MNNTLIDNSYHFRMVEYIKNLLSNSGCTELKIATGYWDLPGTDLIYKELKDFFERGGKFDLLIGQEPMVRSYMLDTTNTPSQIFPDFYIQRDVNRFSNDYKDVVQLLLNYMNSNDEENSQLRVRVYGQGKEKQFLHAKCYIFLGSGCGFAHGIVGSSNFTKNGLKENAELNYLETDAMRVACPISPYINSKSHLTWFEEKWKNSVPWTGKFIQILSGGTTPPPVGGVDVIVGTDELTPYEVYIRLLEDCFGTDDSMDSVLFDYLKNTKYDAQPYQIDAVKQCYEIMKKMGGFMLADVVGLGKTVVAALVIRYYLEHYKDNDSSKNVLIVVPPAIRSGWEETIKELDEHNPPFIMADFIDIVTTGSVASMVGVDIDDEDQEMSFNDKNYNLIVIDESHRFRNKGTLMYDSLDNLIKNIRKNTGKSPYIGLLSATPQNNRPSELQNQISFFVPTPTMSQFTRVPGRNFEAYFADVKKDFASIVDPIADRPKLINLSNDIRDNILSDIIVRRTRKDIVTNYPGTIEFPTTVGPNVLQYNMSPTLAQLFSDSVDLIDPAPGGSTGIGYHRYSAIARFDPSGPNYEAFTKRYEGKNMTVQATSDRLAKIMKLLLIKRLESSFDAFKESLENLGRYTQNMIDMWNDDTIFICPQLNVNDIIAKAKNRPAAYIELRDKIANLNSKGKNVKGQNAEYTRNDFDSNYINDLISDKAIIDALLKRWKANKADPKLDEFKAQLPTMLSNDVVRLKAYETQMKAYSRNNPGKEQEVGSVLDQLNQLKSKLTQEKTKLVIFSEAIATVNKIDKVATSLGYRVLTITAENRERMKKVIRSNFDAKYDEGPQCDDYDIIITTEVLAEGVNLHRANAILNYDSPWNAARLIQRIGRVNRIGSKSKAVFVYNFFPSAQGNNEINLIQNAYRKLQAFHTQFGEDDRVFNPCEILSPADFNSIVSGPASWQVQYMKELKDYKTANPARFKEIMGFKAPLRIAAKSADMNENSVETLCVVNNSAFNSFYVSVDNNATSSTQISMQQIIEHCQCNSSTPAATLPSNLSNIEKKATDAYANLMQQRSKVTKSKKEITEAKRILTIVWAADSRFDSVGSALTDARRLLDAGDKSMADSIISINNEIESRQSSAMPYTSQEIADIINNKMKNIAQKATKANGLNNIFITFNKQQ